MVAAGSIDTNNLHVMTDPIGGQIDPAAIATGLDHLFDQFFTVNFEFDLLLINRFDSPSGGVIFFGFVGHVRLSFSVQSMEMIEGTLAIQRKGLKNQLDNNYIIAGT
jgi:hypothetical protein